MSAERVVVAGAVARRPRVGGSAWAFLQYLLGFRRLGWDVLFLDWVEEEDEASAEWLRSVLEPFGLPFSLLARDTGAAVAGLPRELALARTSSAAFLLNVNGYLDDEEVLAAAQRRVFLDIDPGFGQMWYALGLADVFAGHDVFLTVGENVGRAGCEIPTCRVEWIPTRPPVVLDHWRAGPDGGRRFTTVGAWRGPFGPIDFGGKRYGLRAHEFRKLASLPSVCGREFEAALDIEATDEADQALLEEGGWRLVDPCAVAGDPWAYRRYIHGSGAELTAAKNIYVETRSGWFSDRSVCYLASGKPVLAQDTGLADLYPTGEGLLTFSSLDGAVAGVEEISGRYAAHARSARALAEEYFDSDKVLTRLLGKVGVG
jgi:hypothetical protein